MIVRNEAAVLPRCLESVLPLIDAWVICDTGSTDGTPEVIESLLGHLPGELHHRPWKDFGTNRTELLELARGTAEHLLLLDADHTVELDGALGPLSADEYLVLQCEGIEHWLPRLVRSDLPWRYVGATHEYLACDEPTTRDRIDGLVVLHHGDGGSRSDKLERDRALLEAQLEREPDDQRSTFYLAQTYADLGDLDAAIVLYDRRVELGGWEEEVHVARVRAAELLAGDDLDAGIAALLHAWELRPHRFEPLLALARLANGADRHHLALLATAQWADATPTDDLLFVDPAAQTWGLAFERSIALARAGRVPEAIELTDLLLASLDRPSWTDVDLLLNRQACTDHLAERGDPCPASPAVPMLPALVPGSADVVGLEVDLEPGWSPMNPSVVADESGITTIVRTVNYRRRTDGSYEIFDPDGIVRTRSFLVRNDLDGVRLSIDEVREPPIPARTESPVRGLEDLRLIRWREDWHVVGTARDLRDDWRCQTAVGRLDGAEIADLTPLPAPSPDRNEKNWMPFVSEGRLRFVYSLHPLVVLEWDPDHGELTEVARWDTDPVLDSLRGGAQGLWIDDHLLVIGHTARESGTRRLYQHRFVLLDAELRPTSASPAFSFERYGVEFCAGMTLLEDDLLLSYGVEDRFARVMALALDEVLELLAPIGRSSADVVDAASVWS